MSCIQINVNRISVCIYDDNIDNPAEICLNDICWHEETKAWGFITRHKRQFYFENFNILIPLTSFKKKEFEGKKCIKGLLVETDFYEIERYIRSIFTKSDVG